MDNVFQDQQDRNRNSQVATLDKTLGYQPQDIMDAAKRVVGGLRGYGTTLANYYDLQNQPERPQLTREQVRQKNISDQIKEEQMAQSAADSADTANPFGFAKHFLPRTSGLGIGVPAGEGPAKDAFGQQSAYDLANVDVPYYSDFARDTLKPAIADNVPYVGNVAAGLFPTGAADLAMASPLLEGAARGVTGGLRGYTTRALESGLGQQSALPEEIANITRFRNPLEVSDITELPQDVGQAAQGRHTIQGPANSQLEWRSYPNGDAHIVNVNAGDVQGQGVGTRLLQKAIADIRAANPDAIITADLNSEGGARLFARQPEAEFTDMRGNPISAQEAAAAADRAEGPHVTLPSQPAQRELSMVGGGANLSDEDIAKLRQLLPETAPVSDMRAVLENLGYDSAGKSQAAVRTTYSNLISQGKLPDWPIAGPKEVPPVQPNVSSEQVQPPSQVAPENVPVEPPTPVTAGGSGQPPNQPPANPRFQPTEGYVPPGRPTPGYGVEPPVLTDEERQAVIDQFRQSVPQPKSPVPQSKADVIRTTQEEKYLRGEGTTPIEQPDEQQGFIAKSLRELGGVLGIPQTVMTSFDESAILRQGLPLGIADPATYKQAIEGGLKAFVSTDATRASEQIVHSSPWYNFLKDYGTKEFGWGPDVAADDRVAGFTGLNKSNVSNVVGKVPGIGSSERAFATILNLEGFGTGEKIAQDMWNRGVRDPSMYRDLADVLNAPRGYSRGNIANVLSASNLAFSGRFMKSRVDLILNPFIKKGSLFEPSARQLAAKELVGLATSNAALAAFFGFTGAAAGGAWSVNPDPLSSDFGMLRVGKTRFDTMAGMAPLIRVLIREPVEIRNGNWGKAIPELTRFFANKGAPVPLLLRDIMVNQDPSLKRYLGSGSGLSAKEFALRFGPMIGQDILSAFEGAGGGIKGAALGAATGVADFIGAGTNTYSDSATQQQSSPPKSNGSKPWQSGGVPTPARVGPKKPWQE